MHDLVSDWNPMQRKGVLHGDGPLLIRAGAGSGKTRNLTHRVAHLIGESDVAPWRILAVTFTNKAAGAMRERIEREHPELSSGAVSARVVSNLTDRPLDAPGRIVKGSHSGKASAT